MKQPILAIEHLSKQYLQKGALFTAIKDLTFTINAGEFAACVGPSGCGKTTLLRCIAGIMKPTSGRILLHGTEITAPTPKIGMVFQDFSLFPWLTVEENIAFGLRIQKLPTKERTDRVKHYLKVIGLEKQKDLYPKSLSGGMKQRVAIARTLANDADIILMDEPFASLDSLTRQSMQEFLLTIWEESKKTVVFITHDVEEAMFLSDTVHVLTKSPTTIKKTFTVPFPCPRVHALKHETKFFAFKNSILEVLEH